MVQRFILILSLVFFAPAISVAHGETCPPQTYTVYFDEESANVNPAGQKVVQQLAENAYSVPCEIDWIEIIGHIDSYEATIPDHVEQLAFSRILSVNEELAANEIPRKYYHFDTDEHRNPEETTQPGEKSPRNRRVVITIYFIDQ